MESARGRKVRVSLSNSATAREYTWFGLSIVYVAMPRVMLFLAFPEMSVASSKWLCPLIGAGLIHGYRGCQRAFAMDCSFNTSPANVI